MISDVTIGCVGVLSVSYQAAELLSLAAQRRREARALRTILLDDIHGGRRFFSDPAVREVLAWADSVVTTGTEIPLPRRPS